MSFRLYIQSEVKNRSSKIPEYMPNCTDIYIFTYCCLFQFARLPSQGTVIANLCLWAPFDHCIIFSPEIVILKCYLLSTLHVHLPGTWNNPSLAIILAWPGESSPLSKNLGQCLSLSISSNANQHVMFGWWVREKRHTHINVKNITGTLQRAFWKD